MGSEMCIRDRSYTAMPIADMRFDHGCRNKVFVLLVKGNLVNRIEKLDLELPESYRTPAQQKLSDLAAKQGWEAVMKSTKSDKPHPSRPLWAGGAFLYCNRLDA